MRQKAIYLELAQDIAQRTDKFFAVFIPVQWLFFLAISRWLIPLPAPTAFGFPSFNAAVLIGGVFTLIPAWWAFTHTGQHLTRHFLAISQVLLSSLIIHLMEGRPESYFHVFASLAFLAFYRDPRVLITASAVLMPQILVCGMTWPQTSDLGTPYWLKNLGWVAFVDGCLLFFCQQHTHELTNVSRRQATLENANATIEKEVHRRMQELIVAGEELKTERARSQGFCKMASLGEMAASIAHEIHNPVAAVQLNAGELVEICRNSPNDVHLCAELARDIEKAVLRISKIVDSLSWFSRDDAEDPMEIVTVDRIVEDTLEICRGKFQHRGVTLSVRACPHIVLLRCRPVQISQVLMNLLHNALDAVEGSPNAWVEIAWTASVDPQIFVTDSGGGVPQHLREKIFEPFFTTKRAGKGTGLGLSLSKEIMNRHGGTVECSNAAGLSRFVMKFTEEKQAIVKAA